MAEWLKLLAYALRSRFKSRARLEAENLVLRQQINILIRKLPKRVRLTIGPGLTTHLKRMGLSLDAIYRYLKPELCSPIRDGLTSCYLDM